jgi:uncharacterized protein (TIGR01777 family)
MRIVIAGGTGFIGQEIANYYKKDHEIIVFSRSASKMEAKVHYVQWDGKTFGDWCTYLEGAEMLINLTGKSVDCRYNEENKQRIMSSRVDSVAILGAAIDACENPPKLWLNSSTATIYQGSLTQEMTEVQGIIGDDFSMNVAKTWEEAFFKWRKLPVRMIAMRISLVLGNSGGVLPVLKKQTKMGLGGRHGTGNQKFSWIHIKDLIQIVEYFRLKEDTQEVYNCTAPKVTTNKGFLKVLRNQLGVKFGLRSPKWLLKIGTFILRTETELVLKSRNVIPERLEQEGFKFQFPNIESALEDLCKD